jgi:hypothetical protein
MISSARQRFGHGNTKNKLFLTKLFFSLCLYFRQKGPSLGGGGHSSLEGPKQGLRDKSPQFMVLKKALISIQTFNGTEGYETSLNHQR